MRVDVDFDCSGLITVTVEVSDDASRDDVEMAARKADICQLRQLWSIRNEAGEYL